MRLSVLDPFELKQKNISWTEKFLRLNTQGLNQLLLKKSENFWRRAGENRALTLFHHAAKNIPAYKDFLHKRKIRPDRIRTIRDFTNIPFTDKRNYVDNYPLQDRLWQGNFRQSKILAASSGTTGKPNFWPRSIYQEFEAAIVHELIYKNSFLIGRYRTLLIIGFPMGMYVSGMATVLPSWLVALKGYDLTVVSAGNHKQEILRTVKNLGQQYEQIVLAGHPFFIKDVIESGRKEIDWGKLRIRMMFCSEGFSEEWRDYVLRLVRAKTFDQIISLYGSSELLLMGYENQLSIALRRKLSQNSNLRKKVFGTNELPNLFQYNPLFRYVESLNQELIFTAVSGVPLIRFNIHDRGIIISHDDLEQKVPSLSRQFQTSWQLPFIALWGRSDQTLIFYAANIYPEHIRLALQHLPLMDKLTGKFVMRKGELKNMDEYLEINIELNQQVKPTKKIVDMVQKRIVEKLDALNMEYRFLRSHLDKNLVPRIQLHNYQSEKYFRPGLKPKYILHS